MAKNVRFTPKKTAFGWRLNIPPKYSDTGRRRMLHYPTKEKALEAAAKLKEQRDNFGAQAAAVSPALAERATTAERLLAPLGIDLLEAVRRFVESETRSRASVSIDAAVTAFRASGEDWSDSQARAYRLRGEKLAKDFGGRLISSITGEELQEHLSDTTGGPGAFNQNLRLVRAIWRWCAKPPRKWCELEAVEHLEHRQGTSSEIGILTPAQVSAILTAAETYFPETVPAIAIGIFTGLRQAEIDRLRPCDITAEGITVPAVSAKTKRRRFVEMPEPLAAWLAAYPIGETVTPPDWNRKERAVRRMAGFRVWCDLVPRLDVEPKQSATPPPSLPEWPANGIRHSAATVALALGKPLEQLVFEHGHTGGLEMLRRHYIGAISKADALAIWSIRPHGNTASNLRIA
jgi:hypothetical protein